MVLVLFALMIGLALLPLALGRYVRRGTRAALRHCPGCGSDAVRDTLRRPLAFPSVRITLQCGQCGAWRRVEVDSAEFDVHDRRVRRVRRRIAADAGRLCARRRQAEFASFTHALRVEIEGADDFLARTRAPRTTA